MNRAGRLWRWGKVVVILKRAIACWCIIFLVVVFVRIVVAVFLFFVLVKEKRFTVGSVTAVMSNICWRKKKI